MKFRFRKSVKIAPGIRINFSKSGVSTSIGPRGAKVNISKRGTRVTTGIPGTGLSASKLYRRPTKDHASQPASKEEWIASLAIGAVVFGIMAYAWEGTRTLAIPILIASLIGLYFLLKKPKQKQTLNTAQSTPIDERPATVSTTWEERVAAIEGARETPQSLTQQEFLMTGQSHSVIDHLGNAALAREQASIAERAGNFDAAWEYLQEEKNHFLLHSSKQSFTFENTLSLDATVSEKMANILRKQKRHNDAFAHIAYWVAAQKHRPIKRHNDKFRAYYNRADNMNVSLEEAWSIIMTAPIMNYSKVQMIVKQWLK